MKLLPPSEFAVILFDLQPISSESIKSDNFILRTNGPVTLGVSILVELAGRDPTNVARGHGIYLINANKYLMTAWGAAKIDIKYVACR